jgi:biopolymer transport protein ExbB
MNSFSGISNAHTTNLAGVAPGIAHALLATALGVVAAIPAVLIDIVLARSTAHYRALLGEVEASADAADKEGIKERVALRLARVEADAGRRMTRGTGALATIGATAPFVGLFGTVWGIMTSFIGISKQHTTNLAVVAPGIAEALLATALGLFAAIPAVVIYNVFSRSIAAYRALYGDCTAEVLRLLSRDLDRETSHPAKGRWSGTLAAE